MLYSSAPLGMRWLRGILIELSMLCSNPTVALFSLEILANGTLVLKTVEKKVVRATSSRHVKHFRKACAPQR